MPSNEPTVSEIEAGIGHFSAYQTTSGPGQNISLNKKPAQQLLQAQNCANRHQLSHHENGEEPPFLTDATINAFDDSGGRLTISGERLTRLKRSAKTYINADIMSEQSYHQALGRISGQSQDMDHVTGRYWQNMAVGVCHSQIIDLFIEQQKDAGGTAISKPRTGTIEDKEPGILLLSSPALNEAYGVGNRLSQAEKEKYIEGMFRNLFNATQSEGRRHIAMPPAGLGVFCGSPETYFKALNKVAKEFPDLSIYYNPAQNGKKFNDLATERPPNVHKTDKDVVFLASELSRNGYPCALHNPSDADVVFGMYDPGEYWKTGTGDNYVGEEHIGAMSTAPLNGRLMNPGAYNTPIVNHFTQQIEKQQSIHPNSVIETSPLHVSTNYQIPPQIHRVKQQKNQYHITPEVAGSIYQRVIELGQAGELNGLTNDPRPQKFARALEIVGVRLAKEDLVSRRDLNGYQAKITMHEFQKIAEIHYVIQQQRKKFHITPEIAKSRYKESAAMGSSHQTLSSETERSSRASSSEDAYPLEMEARPCDENDLLNRLKSKDKKELQSLIDHIEDLETRGVPVLLSEPEKEKLQTLMPKLAEIKATAQFKIDLLDYKEKRKANQNQYLTFFGRYTPSFCSTAYSRDEKIAAVDALLNNYSVDKGDSITAVLNEHAGAFTQGRLGDIVTSYNEKIESLQSDNTLNQENRFSF